VYRIGSDWILIHNTDPVSSALTAFTLNKLTAFACLFSLNTKGSIIFKSISFQFNEADYEKESSFRLIAIKTGTPFM
jgi:hypothetical protein